MSGSKVKSGKLGFSENFVLSGSAAAVAKTSAAPIERVKLLLQNQGELLKQGRLDTRYGGVRECVVRTLTNEGVTSFWRGDKFLERELCQCSEILSSTSSQLCIQG